MADLLNDFLHLFTYDAASVVSYKNSNSGTLSIRGNDSSLAEHKQKCLKVEDLGRIEYNLQKTRVTGS
jgi:hypothetical protein